MDARRMLYGGFLAMLLARPGFAQSDPKAVVHTADELRAAVSKAAPGSQIRLAPGEYPGGLYFGGVRGGPGSPIVIAAADPEHPPVIRGGTEGIHLTDPCWVELRDLTLIGAARNGLNIDDGGSYDSPAHHIVLRGLAVREVGTNGNHDGIKLSGVTDFRVEGCTIERWGVGGGSAIDMVGCHRGVIEGSLFRHSEATGNTGVQAKGGTTEVIVRRNRFENAGARAVNIGGSTGLQFFRPPLKAGEDHSEASDIVVEGNYFTGSGAPVAFVGVDGAVVRYNTIYRPARWALRILQETRSEGFVPSRNGVFTDNIVAFRFDEWVEGGVNVGPGTAPATFAFARNFWYCIDDPAASHPVLPTEERGGVYGTDPLFRNAEAGDLRLHDGSPASRAGAEALPR
jgi:hypothetical protein